MTQIYKLLFLAMLSTGTAIACENAERAKKIFNQYTTLAGKFDPRCGGPVFGCSKDTKHQNLPRWTKEGDAVRRQEVQSVD